MVRALLVAFVTGLLLSGPLAAQEPIPDKVGDSNPDFVVEKKSDEPKKYLKIIEFALPAKADDDYRIRYVKKDGSHSDLPKLPKDVTAISMETPGMIERTRGKEMTTFKLSLSTTMDGGHIELRIGKNNYRIKGGTEVESVKLIPPFPWHLYRTASGKDWTAEGKKKAMLSSVRVVTPSGSGAGTIVTPDKGVDALLREKEVLVYSAGHVTPPWFKPDAVMIDVFTYDKDLKPLDFVRTPARILRSGSHVEGDIACLAFIPPRGAVYETAPVGDSKRWYGHEKEYFRVGCRKGLPPRNELMKPLEATFEDMGGFVYFDKASEGGDSGGGVFDMDGFLMGICVVTTNEDRPVALGKGLFGGPEDPKYDKKTYSVMLHPSAATKLLLAAEIDAKENARWAGIELPIAHPKYGKPKDVEESFTEARKDIKAAIDTLPKDTQPEVRKKFEEALKAYEEALKKAK